MQTAVRWHFTGSVHVLVGNNAEKKIAHATDGFNLDFDQALLLISIPRLVFPSLLHGRAGRRNFWLHQFSFAVVSPAL